MCDLKWTWIRWDDSEIVVPKEFHKQKNEGRYLLDEEVLEMLKRRKKEAGDFPYVFWREENGSGKRLKVTTRWIQYKWAEVIAEAGIEDFHFYDLKHTCLSELAATGASEFYLKAISNHASTASLERYVKPHRLRNEASRIMEQMKKLKARKRSKV